MRLPGSVISPRQARRTGAISRVAAGLAPNVGSTATSSPASRENSMAGPLVQIFTKLADWAVMFKSALCRRHVALLEHSTPGSAVKPSGGLDMGGFLPPRLV